jgi:hypothetical protein
VLGVLLLVAARASAQESAETPNPALAERFAAAAQETLRNQDAGLPSSQASAALLRAATRLAPTEPRFARLLAEAVERLGEDQPTIDALTAYRQLVPGDESAQVEQIDLYLRVMETADAKVNYLRGVGGADAVPAPVRAHAMFRLAEVLEERSQAQASDETLAESLKLDPLNLDALAMQYARLPADAPPEKRVASLVALLRSNPAQAQIAGVLGRELSAVGLTKPALQWYATAFNLYARTSTEPSHREVIDYAAAAYIGGESKLAEDLLAQFLSAYPDNVEAWMLRLIVARSSGDKEAAERIRKQAATALTNRLADLRKAAGDDKATTQPIDPPADAQWPDAAAMLERVRAANKPELTEAFADAALSAAWFRTYFEEKPDEAQPWIGVMRALLVEGSQTVARLEGWAFLLQNKPDEARVKLSAAAETDPLAALGLVRLAPKEGDAKAAADADAQKLLAKHGVGLTGATLAEALAFRGIKPAPSPDASAAVNAELAKFPPLFSRILDYPGALYSLRVDPLRTSHQFGEPILLRVTLQNISDFDLTVGPDGIIRTDLWLDAQLRGIANQPFPGVAFDRLSGPIVLGAKKSMSQIVRASQGSLAQYLQQNPTPSIQLSFTVLTNPITRGGQVEPGPAGQRITSARLVERRGTPNNSAVIEQRVLNAMSNGDPSDRIRALELVATFMDLVSRQDTSGQQPQDPAAAAAAAEDMKKALASLRDVMRRGAADGDASVRAWANYCIAAFAPEAERVAGIEAMTADPAWQSRMLGVLLSQTKGGARQVIAKLGESDPDPLVKQYAAAVAALPATTQPSTQAATQATQPTSAP